MNAKKIRFCLEYISDLSAAGAAIRSGYSKKTAREKGYALLQEEAVKSYIEQLKAERSKRLKMDADFVLERLRTYAEATIDQFLNFDGNTVTFKSFDELTAAQKASIESIKEGRNGIELKLYGKSWTLDMIAKHIGLFERDNLQKTNTSYKNLTDDEKLQLLLLLKKTSPLE